MIQELLGGANDGCLYLYDRGLNSQTLCIEAHSDDVNAVSFVDENTHILASGGDDGLCKVRVPYVNAGACEFFDCDRWFLLDPDPLIRGMDPDLLSPSKSSKKNLDSYCVVTSF